MTKSLKPTKSTIFSKKTYTESTPTISTKKQEEISSMPRSSKPEPTTLPKGTKNIVRNFENLQNCENLQKRNSEISKSGLRGGKAETKARVKILEQGTGLRD